MSRAFVKEAENEAAELPDRPISPHRNFVTEAGLAAIEAALGRFEAAHRAATDKGDREAAAAASREVRYWRVRRASAEVVKPLPPRGQASFGTTVTLRRNDGREQSFRIVGEDEADPSRGTVSYVSPLARAVLTHGPGETVAIGAHAGGPSWGSRCSHRLTSSSCCAGAALNCGDRCGPDRGPFE